MNKKLNTKAKMSPRSAVFNREEMEIPTEIYTGDRLLQWTRNLAKNYKKLGVVPTYWGSDASDDETLIDKQNVCATCHQSYPTSYLLDLHVMEIHDSFFAVKVTRGDQPMYACFLEECKQKMYTPKERKEHCMKRHCFPPNFRYDSFRKSYGRKEKAKVSATSNMEVQDADVDMSGARANVKQKPRLQNFSFGHQRIRTFPPQQKKKRAVKPGETLENLDDMKNALNDN